MNFNKLLILPAGFLLVILFIGITFITGVNKPQASENMLETADKLTVLEHVESSDELTSSDYLEYAAKALNWIKNQQDSKYKNAISLSQHYNYDYKGEISGKIDLNEWQELDFGWEPDPFFSLEGSYTEDLNLGYYYGPISGTWGGTARSEDYVIKVFDKTDIEYLKASVPLNPDGTWSTGDERIRGVLKVYLFDADGNIVAYPNSTPTWSSKNYEIKIYDKTDIPYLKATIPLRPDGSFQSSQPPRFDSDCNIRRFSSTVKRGEKIARLVRKSDEKIIDSTEKQTYRLVRSKYIPQDDPLYGKYGLEDRSWIYSNAMAVLAFTIAGEKQRAYEILDTLRLLQNSDGSLYFFYNVYTGQVSGVTTTYSGSLAWVGYSAVYYENKYKEGEFIEFAKRIADYLLSLQVINEANSNGDVTYHGGIMGGYDDNNDKTTLKSWKSTEHNIDAYFFLRDLGELTDIKEYKDAAELVKHALNNYHWYEEEKRFKGGTSLDNKTLDSNSWGAIFAHAIGRDDMANGAMHYISEFEVVNNTMNLSSNPDSYNMTYSTNTLLTGFKPYLHGGDYNNPVDEVWTEGTWGVINVMLRRGEKADVYIDTMLAMQDSDSRGGVITSNRSDGEFHVWPEVAATAWEYITLTDYDGIWTPDK